MSRHLPKVAGLALALALVYASLVECADLLASMKVPLDDRALLSGGEEPSAILRRDSRSDREAMGAFCTKGGGLCQVKLTI